MISKLKKGILLFFFFINGFFGILHLIKVIGDLMDLLYYPSVILIGTLVGFYPPKKAIFIDFIFAILFMTNMITISHQLKIKNPLKRKKEDEC